MKRILIFPLLAIALLSCNLDRDKQTQVRVTILDALDTCEVVISKFALNSVLALDTLTVVDGKFEYTLEGKAGAPDFYYLFSKGKKIVSFVGIPGEEVDIVTNLLGGVSSISGSEESLKFNEVEMQYAQVYSRFNFLMDDLFQAQESKNKVEEARLRKEIASMYVKQKQYAIRYLFENPKSISIIPLIYQKFSQELPVFGDTKDVFALEIAYDSIQPLYPNSPYILYLADDIASRKSLIDLEAKLQSVEESGFPDISLNDQTAIVRKLSDYTGKVILLSFWTVTNNDQKMFNLELLKLYEKYSKRGFEVYQVSVDLDKGSWANVIKDQKLPWVSVCDPVGTSSQYLSLYNVQRLPAMYIIDKSGDIIAKDVFDLKKLESEIYRLTR